MGLTRCLFGSLLALASVGTASAMGATTQNAPTPHATIDSGSHDGGGGDVSTANRDCTLPGPADSSDDGGGGTTPHPRASHHSSLGWQSLLPGSIQ
ncbi:MAG TPA: hypothetical protein VFH59_17795 [Frateuria sp.]|uniref:hypothetical protein n=1 Tax=Frateuria sp. TaxID=2211372 RepID=UPI002D80F126|nr:hypothetical protein [Frateuria sp.]HET6807291.1 hypothetical protein [Frateuria sp.]